MVTISFDRDTYKAGVTATVTYTGAEAYWRAQIISPSRKTYNFTPKVGSGSFKWVIPTDAENGEYVAYLSNGRGLTRAQDTATVSGGVAPPPVVPAPTGFIDTKKATPSTIEVEPYAGYDVMFKLTGYKDKIISNCNSGIAGTITEVSATLEPEVTPPITPPITPPVTKTVTFMSVPSGASINVVSR